MPCRSIIIDRFSPVSAKLRAEFDAKMKDPRRSLPDRFVWDYWHVPGQYTHLRTPAEPFFSKRAFAGLVEALGNFGQRKLGCHGISPPWLSNYVEGCSQELHADVPHGPWAYVLSLTPPVTAARPRAFQGGETLLLRETALDYWSEGRAHLLNRGGKGGFVERDEIVERVVPDFGRLTVFDPRIPHGVSRVSGTHDPREGRLVLHGWFVQPRPFIEGPLKEATLVGLINALSAALPELIEREGRLEGVQSFHFSVSGAGRITGVKLLAGNVRSLNGNPGASQALNRFAVKWLQKYRGLEGQGGGRVSRVTLPLGFE